MFTAIRRSTFRLLLASFSLILLSSCFLFNKPPESLNTVLEQNAQPGLNVLNLTVITDNEEAFENKLKLIQGVKQDGRINLVYYIFSTDKTSARLAKALIDAAREKNARISMLLDYWSNYKHLDYFRMLEHDGGKDRDGNNRIRVRLYNRPTPNVILDAAYMSIGCSAENLKNTEDENACMNEKTAIINDLYARQKMKSSDPANYNISRNGIGSGLFLSGLYSMNFDVLALAVLNGQGIDFSKLAASSEDVQSVSPEDMDNLKKLVSLISQSKVGNPLEKVSAYIQLKITLLLYGEKVRPVFNLVNGLVPLSVKSRLPYDNNRGKDLDHLTDYTHHKLLLVETEEGASFQMGGRNIEDSYHVNDKKAVHKYIFMDTDVAVTLKDDGAEIFRSFSRLFNFKSMVADISDIDGHAPNHFSATLSRLKRESKEECTAEKGIPSNETEKKAIGKCVADKTTGNFSLLRQALSSPDPLSKRIEAERTEFNKSLREFDTYRINKNPYRSDPSFKMTPDETASAEFYYLENLTYDRSMAPDKQKRIYGSKIGEEKQHGKHIHAALLRGMQSVCEKSALSGNREEIILHNAYFAPPSPTIRAFKNMVDGTWDCSNVTLKVITNSFDTTDLRAINSIARRSMKAFFDYYVTNRDDQLGAEFRYYEYIKEPGATSELKSRSLHSKVSVLGSTDIIIGSANMDLRSLMMDTNNALYIKNAPGLIAEYKGFVNGLLKNPERIREIRFQDLKLDDIVKSDIENFEHDVERYNLETKLGEKKTEDLKNKYLGLLDYCYDTAVKLLGKKRKEREKAGIDFDSTFKPL